MKQRRLVAAFTLIEMLITVVIFGAVTLYLGEMMLRQSRAYTVVDNVTEAQQNLRAIGRMFETELRQTGFLVPEGGAVCGYDTPAGTPDTDPDVLAVTAAEAIDPAGVNSLQLGAPLALPMVKPVFNSTVPQPVALQSLVLDGNAFYDLDGDGTADSDFLFTAAPNRQGGVIFVDRSNPARGTACGLIVGINVGANTLVVDFTVNGAVPNPGDMSGGPGAGDMVAIPAHIYWIQPGPPPVLMRDGMVMAQDVEDLQIALFYDLDADGIVDLRPAGNVAPPFHSATEYPGSQMAGSQYVPGSGLWDNTQLEEVRVTLVATTRSQDPDVLLNPAMAQGQPQSFENRAPFAGVPDGFRRRVLTLTVNPRNVGSRTTGF